MFLSMNWISDFVDLSGLDKMDLIAKFSLSTAEVENEIFCKGSDISGIVAAKIEQVAPHPGSDKLHILQVNYGAASPATVVCGAPNVRPGMVTAYAPVGAIIGDITIGAKPVAGVESFGMCCSEKEIGISDDHSGIMEITDPIAPGTDLKSVYQIEDIIFEVDNKSLTNRPDLWGHYGIAREFAALANRPLQPLPTADLSVYNNLPPVDIQVQDPLCQRYSSLQFAGITRHISPVNMRIRLYYCGMRAINFLADLTNYLMLEMGQPMHAFDARKLSHIRVRRFDAPFTFTTLDGVERVCDENTLMICNNDKPVGIAGIMGGLDSEIVEDTSTLTLESATFDAASIRKSTVRLAHRTDASMRYEKSLDPEMTTIAIARFVQLLTQNDPAATVVSCLSDVYAYHYPAVHLSFTKDYVNRYTGIQIDNQTIVNTLRSLGFGVQNNGDNFEVDVPSWRATKDVTIKADIIEEITRIYGYDNFDVHTAAAPLYPVRQEQQKRDEEQIKDLLVKRYSMHEVHSYVWAYYDEYKQLGLGVTPNVQLVNATNPNIKTLRYSMVPNQLCQVKANAGFAPQFALFEIGHVVQGLRQDNLCNEHKHLAITYFSKTQNTRDIYFALRDILAVMADEIKHLPITFTPASATMDYQHPKNLNNIVCGGVTIGQLGIVNAAIAKKIDKKAAIVYAEVDMGAFSALQKADIVYREPSRFPEMEIDLSFVTDTYQPIAAAIEKQNSPLLQRVTVTDVYTGEGGSSITVRLLFSQNDRTLTREEVMQVVNAIVDDLAAGGIALKNGAALQ